MMSGDLLKRIRLISISTRRIVDNVFAGDYMSIYRGRGTEFEEIREYRPGDDDVREIDWNVTARMGETHVRKFREERDISVMLLVDMSGSMWYGSGANLKRDKALEIAALVGMSVVKRNNRIGLAGFTDRMELFLRPKGGRKQFCRMLESLACARPRGRGTDIGRALMFINRTARRPTVLFLVSDFMTGDFSVSLKVASRRFDLIPVRLEDPAEKELPNVGIVEFADSEGGGRVVMDTSDRRLASLYADEAKRRRRECDGVFRSSGLDYIDISTKEDVFPPFRELFSRRTRMRGGR